MPAEKHIGLIMNDNIFIFIKRQHIEAIENMEDEEEARKKLIEEVSEFMKARVEDLLKSEIASIRPMVEEMVKLVNVRAFMKKFQSGSG